MSFEQVRNLRMRQALESGRCVDVSGCPRTNDGDYVLRDENGEGPGFDEEKDYADAESGHWIYSIGEHWDTHEIRASLQPDYYGKQGWKCLWLR